MACWGRNEMGQLGDGKAAPGVTSQTPAGGAGYSTGVKSLALGATFGCLRDAADKVACWGDCSVGQCGLNQSGDGTIISPPGEVSLGGAAVELCAGHAFACARVAGDVFCWGDNRFGQMGVAPVPGGIDKPTTLSWGGTAKAGPFLAVGDANICVHDSADELYCAGAVGNHILGTFGSHRLTKPTTLPAPQ